RGSSPPPPAPEAPIGEDRDFWEAWVDEKQKVDRPGAGAAAEVPPGAAAEVPPDAAAEVPLDAAPASPADGPREARKEPPLEPGMVRLYLSLGRRDRMRPPEVQAFISERTGMGDLRVQVRNTHSYITVTEADAPRVIAALQGANVAGRDLVCEPAKKG